MSAPTQVVRRWKSAPEIAPHQDLGADDDPDDEFVFGLERILDGVAVLVRARAKQTGPAHGDERRRRRQADVTPT